VPASPEIVAAGERLLAPRLLHAEPVGDGPPAAGSPRVAIERRRSIGAQKSPGGRVGLGARRCDADDRFIEPERTFDVFPGSVATRLIA